jgi:hypothetical protein
MRLVEGSTDELMAQGGMYANLYTLQRQDQGMAAG